MSNYEDDIIKEFNRIREKSFFQESDDFSMGSNDLSQTMVIPRVEDLIEERPIEKVTESMDYLSAVGGGEVTGRRSKKNTPKPEGGGRGPKLPKMNLHREKPEKPKKEKPVKEKKKRSIWGILKWVILICLVLGLLGGAAVGIWAYNVIKDAPAINPDNIYELLSENSIIYDSEGNTIEAVYSGDALRTNLEYTQIPDQLKNAFVCIEDKTFWNHHGFNYVRLVGAVVDKVLGKSERIGGTSTITQQLARNLYLTEIKGQRSLNRKLIEAYYTMQLEKKLTKEQILEAYLNTIYLGYNSNGVAAAAQAYFSKDVEDLNILECAQLAALPQSPNNYAPLKRIERSNVENLDALDIISENDDWIVYYNATASNRINLVLRFMNEQGKLSDADYEAAKADSIRNYLNPGTSAVSDAATSYFADYVKAQVMKDLLAAGYDKETANNLLYSGGLRIYSTMNSKVQAIMDTEYANADNFPGINIQSKDAQGNALDANKKILLYNMANYFNADGDFVLGADEYEKNAQGDLIIYGGKRLNFYKTSVAGGIDYSAEFKGLYEVDENKVLYSRAGGVWNIAAEYKDRDSNGNLVLSHKYFEDHPNTFTFNSDGTVTLGKDYFTLKTRVRQPQSAMVIMDYETGYILGMIGGRDITGKMLYNRATSSRQPGSSIKPLAVYSLALQLGYEGRTGFTAAKPIDDTPITLEESIWPKNWYTGYRGMTNLRNAVEQSINACSVNLFLEIGDPNKSISQLQKMGITTLATGGDVNDVNSSSMALGGMVNGISPLEMTAAYGTFGNDGVYTEPICYTKVTTSNGDVILTKTANQTKVLDEPVASLMTDILRTTVTNGLGSRAKLKSQPSAGKTGTTSERYDIWFCGLTPQYSAACWIGSDVNLPVNSDSSYAAKLWAKIMDQVGAMVPREEFVMKGEFVTETVNRYSGAFSEYSNGEDTITEIFIKGTEPSAQNVTPEIGYKFREVCTMSGYLAVPGSCPSTTRMGIVRPGGLSWEKMLASYIDSGVETDLTPESVPDAINDLPDFYCPIHNTNTDAYPVSPFYVHHEDLGLDNVGDYDIMDGDDLLNPDVVEE